MYADAITFFVTRKCQKIQKMIKIFKIEEQKLHMF